MTLATFETPEVGAINCPGATEDQHKAKECDNYDFITTADPTKMQKARENKVSDTTKTEDKYLNGKHDLEGHMKITQNWTTPIGELDIKLPEEMRLGLIRFVASRGYCTTMGTHKKTQTPEFERNHYNLFDYGKDDPEGEHISSFEKISSEIIRYYLANSYDLSSADDLRIEARGFGNMQTYGRRTYPHYHHGFDGVFIHYLTVGDEFQIKEFSDNPSDTELAMIPAGSTVDRIEPEEDHGKIKATFNLDEDDLPCDGSGNLILCDPRPAINYPYCNKAIAWEPKVGTTLLHPAYVWHESNHFTGKGIRASIVINYRGLTRNNSDLLKPLSNVDEQGNFR